MKTEQGRVSFNNQPKFTSSVESIGRTSRQTRTFYKATEEVKKLNVKRKQIKKRIPLAEQEAL